VLITKCILVRITILVVRNYSVTKFNIVTLGPDSYCNCNVSDRSESCSSETMGSTAVETRT